jgi:hypothetical protein
MDKLRYLSKNINILNILLFITFAMFLNYLILPFFKIHFQYSPQTGKKALTNIEGTISERPIPSLSDYVVVAEENLFHPERKIPPEKKEEPPPLPKPDVVLYGTIVTDEIHLAYLEDLKSPRNTPGRGRRQLTMREGDILSGFIIKKIEADKIKMVRGQEEMVVSIHDHKEAKTRGTPPPDQQATAPQQPPQPQAAKPKTEPNRSRKRIDQDVSEFFRKRANQ